MEHYSIKSFFLLFSCTGFSNCTSPEKGRFLLIIIFARQSCVVRTSYPDQAALLVIPGIPQVAQQKRRRLPICRYSDPESRLALFISVAQKPVPDKVLIICL